MSYDNNRKYNFYERRRYGVFCKLCEKYLNSDEIVSDMVRHGAIKIIMPIPQAHLIRKGQK